MSARPDATTEPSAEQAAVKPRRCYLVCATPRSGSTLLCEGLESTEVAGRPREYFEELKETGVSRRPREYFGGLRFFSSRRRHTRFDCDWSSRVLFRSRRRRPAPPGSRSSPRRACPTGGRRPPARGT